MTDAATSPAPDRPVAAERLHQQISLITAPTWLLTVVLVGVIAGAVLWSVFGTVLVQVSGRGLLVSADSLEIPVFVTQEGRLVKTLVSPGDQVKSGQQLFELDQPELDLELKLAKQKLTELQNVLKMVSDNADAIIAKQQSVTNDQLAAVDKQTAQLQNQVDFFTKHLSDLETLLKSGDTTQDVVEAARQSLDAATLALVQAQAERASFQNDLLQSTITWQRQKLDAQIAVEGQKATVAELQERVAEASDVVAANDGTVSEVLATEGQWIAAGSKIAIIGTSAPGYQVLAFFSPLDGQRLKEGMSVDVVPSTVKREEYGTMEGAVSDVSARPVSMDEAVTLLGNQSLANYLTGNEPPIFARIKVATMPGNPEEFVWRNGSGPPYAVTTGTVTDAEVTVQEQAPISLVLPYLDTLLGF